MDYTIFKKINFFKKIPIEELENIAYKLQIFYIAPLKKYNRYQIIEVIKDLIKNISKYEQLVEERKLKRVSVVNDHTLINQKNIHLLSDQQLIFLPQFLENGDIKYYAYDRFDDIDYLLKTKKNTFTTTNLSEEQIKILEEDLKNNKYPRIPCEEFMDEYRKIFYTKQEIKNYEDELKKLILNVNLNFKINDLSYFCRDLDVKSYNLFCSHTDFNFRTERLERDSASKEIIQYLIEFCERAYKSCEKDGDRLTKNVSLMISEFIRIKQNRISYDKAVQLYGLHIDNIKQLTWKPVKS